MNTDSSPTQGNSTNEVDTISIFAGMQPAFKHAVTGELHLAQLADGSIANEYSFAALPDDWVAQRDTNGIAIAIHAEVIPGYWIDNQFYSFSQLSEIPLAA